MARDEEGLRFFSSFPPSLPPSLHRPWTNSFREKKKKKKRKGGLWMDLGPRLLLAKDRMKD